MAEPDSPSVDSNAELEAAADPALTEDLALAFLKHRDLSAKAIESSAATPG